MKTGWKVWGAAGAAAMMFAAGVTTVGSAAPIDPASLKRKNKQVPVEQAIAKVNEEVKAMWNKLELTPTTRASDSEWARRAYIDLIGRVPTYQEISKFLASKDAEKRSKLIDELLAGEECAEHFATYFGNLLVGRIGGQAAAEIGVDRRAWDGWAKESFLRNKPWDQWVMEILTAKGTPRENPGANFYLRVKADATEVAGRSTQFFLGVQIQCAQCHNHPFDEWKQADFWGVAGFFVRTRTKNVGGQRPGQLYREQGVFDESTNEEAQYYIKNDPRLPRQTQLPKFLKDDAQVIDPQQFNNQGVDRRFEFARWVTAPDNPYFAKAAVNRMWYYFLGRGIVNPVDDMGSSKRPVSVKLLNEIAEDFTKSGFDLKRLIKVIAMSEPYQLSSTMPRVGAKKPEHATHFTHYYIKTMTPEQLFYSIVVATGGEDARNGRNSDSYLAERSDLLAQFVSLIDNDENKEVTKFEGSIPLALRLLNGDIINKRVKSDYAGLQYYQKFAKSDGEMLNALYLSTLSRLPSPAEVAKVQTLLKGRTGSAKYEDIFWALLNTSEFMFIH
jgi:hypothetical protein